MKNCNSKYIIYVAVAVTGLLSISSFNSKKINMKLDGIEKKGIIILTSILTFFMLAANYDLFYSTENKIILYKLLIILCGSVTVWYNFLMFAYHNYIIHNDIIKDYETNGKRKIIAFLFPFITLISIYSFYLFNVVYPGILTIDSIIQVSQAVNEIYSNHHPVYHTLIIRLFYDLGMKIFADESAAVATYCFFQIIMMSAAFSYAILTLYEIKADKKYIVIIFAMYALLPYFWAYASTVWKDVLYGGVVLSFIITLFRCRKDMGNKIVNYLSLLILSIGCCILRSNGIFAYMILLLFLIIRALYKKEYVICAIAFLAFLISGILRGPVLNMFDIAQPDIIESLSIPSQQIARVIYDGKELSQEDMDLLDKILDVDKIKEFYNPNVSDNIKELVRLKGGNQVIEKNKIDIIKLWILLGLRYPDEYIKAWVDQTVGYWNGGYRFWVFIAILEDNDLGIVRQTKSDRLWVLSCKIFELFVDNEYFSVAVSIGIVTWIYLILFMFNIMHKKENYLECVMPLSIVASLLIATPVFCEFRYAYSLFTTLPFAFYIGVKNV